MATPDQTRAETAGCPRKVQRAVRQGWVFILGNKVEQDADVFIAARRSESRSRASDGARELGEIPLARVYLPALPCSGPSLSAEERESK